MPNWCNNVVTITHDDRAKLEDLAAAIKQGRWFSHVIPVPDDLRGPRDLHHALNPDRPQKSSEMIARDRVNNMAEYGATNHMEFCYKYWGTKWDVARINVTIDEQNTIKFRFDTAWGPPLGIYRRMIESGFKIRANYLEPDSELYGEFPLA